MKTLTVFTPAFNRAHTIGRTYQSLCRQTCKDFCWLIVDDGSTDNTCELVEGWVAEGKIPIQYIYQDNQGMHGAHNTAYHNIDTPLNTCIDSDDYMPDDAVEKILKCWTECGNDKVAGIIGLDVTEEGRVIGTRFPDGMTTTTLQGFYQKGGKGDKKLVYRTDVIKRYPDYPLFEGERYVGLAYKYMLIDQDYELITLNEPLVVVEYQQDGSSLNMWKQYWRNPKGFIYDRKLVLSSKPKLLKRFKYCIHYISSKLIAREYNIISDSPCKLSTLCMLPIGYAFYSLIKHKVKKDSIMNITR